MVNVPVGVRAHTPPVSLCTRDRRANNYRCGGVCLVPLLTHDMHPRCGEVPLVPVQASQSNAALPLRV